MADEFGALVGLGFVLVNLLRQLIRGKVEKAQLKVGSLGTSSVLSQPHKRRRMGRAPQASIKVLVVAELIAGLGDERRRKPDARTGQSSVTAPFVTAGEAPQVGERSDLTKPLI